MFTIPKSKSSKTSCTLEELLYTNSSNTPTRVAPDDDASGPVLPSPILPMYKSDPLPIPISPITSSSYPGRVVPIPTFPPPVTKRVELTSSSASGFVSPIPTFVLSSQITPVPSVVASVHQAI